MLATLTAPSHIASCRHRQNFVSPWDTQPSTAHSTWRKTFPQLAALHKPRQRRGLYSTPNALEEAPESMDLAQLDVEGMEPAALEQEAIQRVLKRLLSNEAAPTFLHPVPTSEVEYHKQVDAPICLRDMMTRAEADGPPAGYDSYGTFHRDVEQLMNNSFGFNDDDTIEWIHTCMIQKDYNDACQELKVAGLDHLLNARLNEPQPVDALAASIAAEAMDEDEE